MNILHCLESLSASSGGPSRTVTALCEALAKEPGLKISLCSQVMAGETPVTQTANSPVIRRLVPADTGIWRRFGLPLSRLAAQIIAQEKPALVHDHGLWTPPHHAISRLCRRHNIPLALHPRGMLEPWALSWHAWRKKIAWNAYVKRDLHQVALFMATAEQEVASIRRLGFRQPIACIPNGVFLPDAAEVRRLGYLREKAGDEQRTALFLGRIHQIKGLFNLLDAWTSARPTGWRLILAGPDEGGHGREVAAKICVHHLENQIRLVDEVRGADKARLFAEADLFILPSFSENFGVAVAEALSYGVPVITTTGTPWRALGKYGCGWWIEPTVSALTDSLRQAFAMSAEGLRQMGERGRPLAANYDWRTITRQTTAAYHWLLSGGAKPDWIFVD
ncbi:MAG: glycosyltransferase [Desulfobulbaceae bacterium]|jgi:glycosyltransferase involved in cell wall biosynthesis|nr:glycosyltransferase [Desulfobulbaceae bacterium]